MSILPVFIILTVNSTHLFFYLRLSTRNPLRFLPVYLGFPPLMFAAMQLGRMYPEANGVFMPAALLCWAGLIRLLVTKDGFSRLLFCIASIIAFSQVIRTPIFLAMAYGLELSTEKATIIAAFTYPVVFLLLTPFLLRYVREPLRLILGVAETQKWYLVCLPPLILTSIGDTVHFPGEGMTDAFKLRAIGMLMPVCVTAYFVSIYRFMTGQRDKLVLRLAAEALSVTRV